jgi:ABC-type oligopeptide transport system substrate-binding subunit
LFAPGEDFDTPYLTARAATTTDASARHAAEAMHAIIDQDIAVIPIAGIYRIWGVRDVVQGFVAHPSSTNQEFGSVTVSR